MILVDSAQKADVDLLAIGASLLVVINARLNVTPKACTKSSHVHSRVNVCTFRATIAAKRRHVAKIVVYVGSSLTIYNLHVAIPKTMSNVILLETSASLGAPSLFKGRFRAAST